MPAPPPPGRGAAAATPDKTCASGPVAFGSPRARRARVATTVRSKENKERLLGRSVVGFLKANTAALLFSLVVFSCALAAAAEAVPATSAPRRLLSAATFPATSSREDVANAFDPATDPRAVETKSETKSAYAISGDVGDSRDSRVAAAARPRPADNGKSSARAAIFPSRATVRGGALGIGRERDPLVRPSPLSNGGGSSASRPASASRPTTPDEAAGGVAYDDANVPPTWGVSSLEAVRRDAEWCPPGATDFAKCDPAPNQIPTPRVPAFDAVNGSPGAKSAHGASSQTSSDIQSRADWENDLEMRPFRLRWQQPVRAVPQVTHAVDVAKTDPTSGVVSTRKQTFEWYEMRQMLSFASLFPARTCAADDTVCRPCETAAAGSNPLAEGLPKADDETADCVTEGGKNLRCLKAGEVPFWWYNGLGPGPLIRVPTDLKWRNARGKLNEEDQKFIAPNLIVRQKNDLPWNCAGGATTHDDLECKIAITSTHHHGSSSLPGFDGWADDVTVSGQHKDYCYVNDMGPRTNWYHDHGIHNTGFNVANGLFAMYPIYVPPQFEEGPHGERVLPRWIDKQCDVFSAGPGNARDANEEGHCFELPMILSEARFNNEGGVTANSPPGSGVVVKEGTCRVDYEIEGNMYKADVVTVNGVPWPKMTVFAGYKYRARVLGATITRAFRLLLSGDNCARMLVVGSDTELLLNPVVVPHFDVNAGERYQVVFDFSSCVVPAGKKSLKVRLRNAHDFLNNEDYLHTDKVMLFVVKRPSNNLSDEGQPARLAYDWDAGEPLGPCASNAADDNCAAASLAPPDVPNWYVSKDVCLLSPNDARSRREAVQTALKALRVVRGVDPDAATGKKIDADLLTENRPVSVRVDARLDANDPASNPDGFATLSDSCHSADELSSATPTFTTHARTETDNPNALVEKTQCVTVRTLIFARTGGEWVINDKTWRSGEKDQMGRVEASTTFGCLEVWHIVTGGGGWHHPVHLHLIDGWLIERRDGREEEALEAWPSGRGVFPYETGSKDVFFAGFNEHLIVAFWAEANRGNYMFHCHNLIHEDDDMLLAFTVTHELTDANGEKIYDQEDGEPVAVPVAKQDDPAIETPPFETRFPFESWVTPGESGEDGESSAFESAKRYVYPKSYGNKNGVMTANSYMFEYQRLHDVQSPIKENEADAKAAIDFLFGAGGEGRFGKYYEKDGSFFASGSRNENGDLLLDENAQPAQTLRAVDVEEKFWPTA